MLIPGTRIVSDQLDFSAVHIVALERRVYYENLTGKELFKKNNVTNGRIMSHGYLILLVDSLQVIIGGKLHQTLILPGLNKGKQVRTINIFEWPFSP